MRYERVGDLDVPKVGFGTWSIGGGMTADRGRDTGSLAALRSAIEIGYTHFDTAESYADGHCEELLGRAMREARIDRSGFLITSKVKAENLSAASVSIACEGSLRRLGTEYLDLYLIHWPNPSIPLAETFKALNALVRSGKIRHVGVSNFDLDLLRQATALADAHIVTNQIPLSLVQRAYARNGVVEYCQANDILVTAYSPLKKQQLHAGKAAAQLAGHRGLTRCQVAIAWLCSQQRVITIPMSADPQHQRENLEAADIELSPAELRAIG